MEVEKQFFTSRLKPEDKLLLEKEENDLSIFELMEAWLERMPFADFAGFNFWGEYAKAVETMLKQDHEIISTNPSLTENIRTIELKNLELTRSTFKTLLDANLYEKNRQEGKVRLSQRAMLSCVFIYLYRDYPALQMAYKLLNSLVEIDENFTTWRYRHAIMVQRILGTKIGTGGSAGHEYLKATTERNRAFLDLFNMATFLIPRSAIPQLPTSIKEQLDIVYDSIRS